MAWLPIKYREFYDVPRAIVVERDGELYLFDSPFDAEADESHAYFAVYRLPAYVASQLDSGTWEDLAAQGELLGRVAAGAVELDRSRRSLMNDEVSSCCRRVGDLAWGYARTREMEALALYHRHPPHVRNPSSRSTSFLADWPARLRRGLGLLSRVGSAESQRVSVG